MIRFALCAACLIYFPVFAGCSSQSDVPTAAETPTSSHSHRPSAAGERYRLDAEPAGAQDVAAVRANSSDGDEVVVAGRIGGDVNPWVKGRAAFTIVDNSLQACSDIPGDACPTPWDYCCETDKLKTGKLLVKFVDDAGLLVASDARDLLGVGELDSVIVQGTVQKSADGNTVLLANRLYVRAPGGMPHAPEGAHHHDHDHHDHGAAEEQGDDPLGK